MRNFLTATEASALLGVSPVYVRRLAASGRLPAEWTSAGWMLDGHAVMKEARMRQHGRITQERMREMLASFPAGRRREDAAAVLRLLTDPPSDVELAAAYPVGDDYQELPPASAALFPPKTQAEAQQLRRQQIARQIAASAAGGDDYDEELPPDVARLFPEGWGR